MKTYLEAESKNKYSIACKDVEREFWRSTTLNMRHSNVAEMGGCPFESSIGYIT